jgi:hypothetical protein
MDHMIDTIEERLDYLEKRLRSNYNSIGQSSGRPYIYFVYDPWQERLVQRLVKDRLRSNTHLIFHSIDILKITIASLKGQEEMRQKLLNNRLRTDAPDAIMRLWTREISSAIRTELQETQEDQAPVVVLYNLASLHPIGNPTSLMEFVAEQEPRNPQSNTIVPIVLLVPGFRPPQTSRLYNFLDQERLQLDFYRGEEI